uniref:Saposin B-type domain-containing protein n=1 Tax=Dromaius novaehollandiae TaxID=8790 RepID=A0A8C4KBS4_DRONO
MRAKKAEVLRPATGRSGKFTSTWHVTPLAPAGWEEAAGAFWARAVPDVSLSPQKGIPCHLCRMAVSVVGKILQDNCTEEKLHGFLQKKCQVLPFQDWVVKCKKMVDTGILADPKVVCGTLRLCQPRQRPAGALRFRQPPPPASPREDFARLVAPFTADVPLLRQPQDARRGPALPAPREQGDVCGDCARLVAALRAQVDTGALGVPAVVTTKKELFNFFLPFPHPPLHPDLSRLQISLLARKTRRVLRPWLAGA